MGRDDVLSRNAIESMIAEGHTVVVYNNNVLKLDSMLDNHKGGNLAIRHMVGRDATDEITV
jgi:delta8-fatty-acid desaturase